ncbi:MAG: class I SAM-dependent methyltransferase [Xanthomonadales bacterium]|nr:class I SAM-dependent methyltransferase [Xanthomonadales bacterium]
MTGSSDPLFNPLAYPLHVSQGRDIRAGHLRGCWLEFADLVQTTLTEDRVFMQAIEAARSRGSLLSDQKLGNLFLVLRYAMAADAPIFEFGSYRGGSAVFMASIFKSLARTSRVYAFDTFEGMPITDAVRDLHSEGDFHDADLGGLREFIASHDLGDHLSVIQGRFDETLPDVLTGGVSPGVLHIDCDIYEPIKYVIRTCAPHMRDGGHIILDDPLHGSCLGAFDAVQEVLVREMALTAEQAYPHLVYRYPPLRAD